MKIERCCITCQHHDYEHYHCLAKGTYIGYSYAFEKTKCREWALHENYKKGGKFYEYKKQKHK